jgi:hypothetical protein
MPHPAPARPESEENDGRASAWGPPEHALEDLVLTSEEAAARLLTDPRTDLGYRLRLQN